MDNKIDRALQRLDAILPLLSGLRALSAEEAGLYCKLLNCYIERGTTLTRDEIDAIVANPERALANIVASKLVVLDAAGNPAGAYPFTSQEREHRVHIGAVTAHCMCALDALAVSPMFDRPVVIDSRCRVSGDRIHLEQNNTAFSGGTLGAWFGIDWGAASDDSVCAESLCLEMMFLADADVAAQWLAVAPGRREIFDLQSAADFAAAFFLPLAESCRTAT